MRSQPPTSDALLATATAAISWTTATVASKSPCYRVHLSYLYLRGLELAGAPVSDKSRDSFCRVTGKAGDPSQTAIGIPVIDHYCGRAGLQAFVDGFEYNTYEYAFKICSLWEPPEAGALETPGLDYLVGWSELF